MLRRLLVALACLVLVLGAASGCSKKKKKKGKKGDTVEVSLKNVKDRVEIEVEDDGFHPDRIPAAKGRPITLVFTRTDSDGCDTVVIAEENIRKSLPKDQPVQIVIMPGHTGRVHYACPDGKTGGDLEVQ